MMEMSAQASSKLRFELLANDVDRCAWTVLPRQSQSSCCATSSSRPDKTPIDADDLSRDRGLWSGECVVVYSCLVSATQAVVVVCDFV